MKLTFLLKNTAGDNSRRRKLCSKQVKNIRSLQGKKSAEVLAKQYGVQPQTIRAIWRRHAWRSI